MYNYNPYYPNSGAMPDMLNQLRTQPVQQVAQPSNGIVWVQGEAAAKSFVVSPNTTVMLLDSENSVFYLKTSDASGMPLPLRVFDYSERTQNAQNSANFGANKAEGVDFNNFVTHDQLQDILANFALNSPVKKTTKKGDDE